MSSSNAASPNTPSFQMRHVAAEHNANGQLGFAPFSKYDNKDSHYYRVIYVGNELECEDADIRVLYICRDSTVFVGRKRMIVLGPERGISDLPPGMAGIATTLQDGF